MLETTHVRPVYETEADRYRELAVATSFADVFGLKAVRNPRMYAIDWALYGDRLRAWVEVKVRGVSHRTYPSLMLSCHKFDHGMRYAERFGVPFLLVVKYTDGVYYWKGEDSPELWVGHGGRSDRGDWQDMEPVVHIPTHLFKTP